MSGKAIGKTLDIGYAGTVSRSQDCIISNRPVNSESEEIMFGQAVVLNADNTISKIKDGDTANKFLGIAVREVKQSTNYLTSAGSYLPEPPADIFERGTIAVKCNNGTPTAGGKVYVRVAINEEISTGVIGEFEAEADEETVEESKVARTLELPNVVFATGKIDANGITEVKILNRNI